MIRRGVVPYLSYKLYKCLLLCSFLVMSAILKLIELYSEPAKLCISFRVTRQILCLQFEHTWTGLTFIKGDVSNYYLFSRSQHAEY